MDPLSAEELDNLPRVFFVRITDCPITNLERWRYAAATSTGNVFISINQSDRDILTICFHSKFLRNKEGVWQWKPL